MAWSTSSGQRQTTRRKAARDSSPRRLRMSTVRPESWLHIPSSVLADMKFVDTSSQGITPSTSGPDGETIHVPATWNTSCPPRCVCRSTQGEIPIPRMTDDEALAIYVSQLMPVFPFVLVEPGTTAGQLKAKRPLLFAAIRMASSFSNVRSMRAQMYQLIQRVTQEIMISSARSVDIVQALLVMMGWFQNHCIVHAQLNSLLHLAQAQLADTGLDREAEIQERTSVLVLHPRSPPPRVTEERRATLGVWFLTSV